jgi:hypothetical protein
MYLGLIDKELTCGDLKKRAMMLKFAMIPNTPVTMRTAEQSLNTPKMRVRAQSYEKYRHRK